MLNKPICIIQVIVNITIYILLITWNVIASAYCEPVIIPYDLTTFNSSMILAPAFVFAWFISISFLADYPSGIMLLFFLSSMSTLINSLCIEPKIPKQLPAFITGLAYSLLIISEIGQVIGGDYHIAHFGTHILLFSVSTHDFLSNVPWFWFPNQNTCRIYYLEAFAHLIASILEPVYWFLLAKNVVELLDRSGLITKDKEVK